MSTKLHHKWFLKLSHKEAPIDEWLGVNRDLHYMQDKLLKIYVKINGKRIDNTT